MLVGFSGGPDSLCLLDVLHRAGFAVTAAHFDHRLRAESGQDADAAQALADRLGVPFIAGSRDVAAYARQEKQTLEAAARYLRYRFLFEQARRLEAQAVAVGHTADDQVETVLMHLLRGAGLSGLAGMSYQVVLPDWDPVLPVVRPLLDTWRNETLAYCAERGLEPVFDQTNQDSIFLRNRLRNELIPFLETFNPQARQSIWRTAQVLAGDLAVVQQAVEAAWTESLAESGPGFVALRLAAFRALLPGLQRGVLRKAAAYWLTGSEEEWSKGEANLDRPRELEFQAVERGLEFLIRESPVGIIELGQGLRLWVEGDLAFLGGTDSKLPGGDWPQMAVDSEVPLPLPGEVDLLNGWSMTSELVDAGTVGKSFLQAENQMEAYLDAEVVLASAPERQLFLRPGQPGDRFRPLGLARNSIKLSDFWINQKLPRRARAGWPLVVSGRTIAWIPGWRIAHPFRVTDQTSRIVHLRLQKKTS